MNGVPTIIRASLRLKFHYHSINTVASSVAGAHVRQPVHRGVRVGGAGGGPGQEDGRVPVVGALRPEHLQVNIDNIISLCVMIITTSIA